MIEVIDPKVNSSFTEYDANDNVTRTVNARTNPTIFVYDARDRLVATTDATGKTATTVYDAVGNVINTIDRTGAVTTFVYDASNRQTAVINARGKLSTTEYSPAGDVTRTVDRGAHVTTFLYDGNHRQTLRIDSLEGRTTSIYDGRDLVKTIGPNGKITVYEHDANHRVTKVTDSKGNVTKTIYDGRRVAATVDARNKTTAFHFLGTSRRNRRVEAGRSVTGRRAGSETRAERGGRRRGWRLGGAEVREGAFQGGAGRVIRRLTPIGPPRLNERSGRRRGGGNLSRLGDRAGDSREYAFEVATIDPRRAVRFPPIEGRRLRARQAGAINRWIFGDSAGSARKFARLAGPPTSPYQTARLLRYRG